MHDSQCERRFKARLCEVSLPLAAFTLNLSLLRASSVSKSHFTSSYKAYRDTYEQVYKDHVTIHK